ncbi:VCBS repeat-containing protein [bacterium]|nr:VCBS repeat-containing protein [bacterium]
MADRDYNSPLPCRGPAPRRMPRWLRTALWLAMPVLIAGLFWQCLIPAFNAMQLNARRAELRRALLETDEDGRLRQRFDSPGLLLGNTLNWRELWRDGAYEPDAEFSFLGRQRNAVTADFDGDGEDELYIAIFGEQSVLLRQDGSVQRLPAIWDARTAAPPIWDHDNDGIPSFILQHEIGEDGRRVKWQWGDDALLASSINGAEVEVLRDPDKVRSHVLLCADFLGTGDRQLAYGAFAESGYWDPITTRILPTGGQPQGGFGTYNHFHSYLLADVDGDGMDEQVFRRDGSLRCFGFGQQPQEIALPGHFTVTTAADVDKDGCDELLYCSGDGMLMGERLERLDVASRSQEFMDSLSSADPLSGDFADRRELLRIQLADRDRWIDSHPDLERYRGMLHKLTRQRYESDIFIYSTEDVISLAIETLPDMLEPRGGIFDPQSGQLLELSFPDAMSDRQVCLGYSQPLVVADTSTGSRVFTCSVGGGLFGFDAASGDCIHFETFGENIVSIRLLHGAAGERLVLELTDRYLISAPII